MNDDPIRDAEVEIICAACGYHMPRTAQRLRREIEIVCPNCGEVIVPDADDDLHRLR